MVNFNTVVPVSYATIQLTIAIIVSIYGAIFVRKCRMQSQNSLGKKENEKNDAGRITSIEMQSTEIKQSAADEEEGKKENEKNNAGRTTSIEIQSKIKQPAADEEVSKIEKKQKSFCEEWLRTIWKMRGVYSGLAVHSFDVLTDILVIIEWMEAENTKDIDHIDSQVMAYSAIGVMAFSKCLSTLAIWIKEKDISRCILQFFDLLIFEEIYESHDKIRQKVKLKDEKAAIESTISFKYVRNMEATFESIPQAILQLVFVMRTSEIKIIFIISILQSIISMSNSVLNHDNTQMQDDEFKEYKQRLPPTLKFVKHAISRLAEIAYRIGLLALLWTVCQGFCFSVIIGIELCVVFYRIALARYFAPDTFNADSILLAISFLIVIPAEDVYASGMDVLVFTATSLIFVGGCVTCCNPIFWITAGLLMYKEYDIENGSIPFARIIISLGEFIFLILWAFFGDKGQRYDFLLSYNHGLSIFISTCVFYFIYALFPVMFPNFSLPFNVNVRSKWGYAYSNELSELQKIKVPKKFKVTTTIKVMDGNDTQRYEMNDSEKPADFWDETIRNPIYKEDYGYHTKFPTITAAMFALSKGNEEIVAWLEEQGAEKHKTMDDNGIHRLRKYFSNWKDHDDSHDRDVMIEIPLEIHSYRGYDAYNDHPKNLLSDGDKGYRSSTEYDARNDWIIFKVCDDYHDEKQKEDNKAYDTLEVKIMNLGYDSRRQDQGLKQICLHLQYSDSDEWIKTTQINDIGMWGNSDQYFPVLGANINNLTM
eukprot:31495_1